MKFSICRTLSSIPDICSLLDFYQIVKSPQLEQLANEIALGNKEKKRCLPAACWQASYGGKRRANENAVSSGLFALDIDDVENPEGLYESFKSRLSELGILVVHITPSRKGLRIVAKCRKGLHSIRENQFWLAGEIGARHDAATCDAARLSYLVPWDYFLFFDEIGLSGEPDVLLDFTMQPVYMPAADILQPMADITGEPHDPQIPHDETLMFQGVHYYDIVENLVDRLGVPVKGMRNTCLFRVCRNLANITDRNPDLLFRICPRFGLDEDEVRMVCNNACRSARTERLPAPLYKTLRSLGIDCNPSALSSHTATTESDKDILMTFGNPIDGSPVAIRFPDIDHLPPLIHEFVATVPEDFREATAMVCLPVCGFLGSRLRSVYTDEEPQAPSFIVNIIAPAASGKSILLHVPNVCLRKIRETDDEGRALEAEYDRQQKLLKNAKKQVEEPHPIIRDIPVKVSVAELLKRMQQAMGLHLISIVPEADTMTNSNKAGSWSMKTDIYRVAQDGDGGRYGQDYKSDTSFNATCKMRYNLVALGTPGAMARAYPDVEDGLITRCIMVTLPDQFGKQMPVRTPMTKHQLKVVNDKIDALMDICQDSEGKVLPEHFIALPWLRKAIGEWGETQRLRAIRDNDRARDQFRRRSALIGFRAGMVAAFLWGRLDRKRKDYTIEFSLWVAEYILQSLMNRYGQKVNDDALSFQMPRSTRYPSLFDTMGDIFTPQDLRRAAMVQGCKSPLKSIIYFWTTNGLIEKQGDSFVKLVK